MNLEYSPADPPQIVKFCDECNNLLVPTNEEKSLVYKCIKSGCTFKTRINSQSKDENLVSTKLFSKDKNLIVDKDFALDPTMPRSKVTCGECGFDTAVFFITTDVEDSVIELVYICANKECGHSWRVGAPDKKGSNS